MLTCSCNILGSLFVDAQSMAKDEDYEKGVVKGNMVYKIHWTEPPTLMPVESMCGHIPQVSIFDTKEVMRKILNILQLLVMTQQQMLIVNHNKKHFCTMN